MAFLAASMYMKISARGSYPAEFSQAQWDGVTVSMAAGLRPGLLGTEGWEAEGKGSDQRVSKFPPTEKV